jgi:hypothetical protein
MTWQTKLIAILLVLTSLFVWHKYEVSKAVTKTIAEQTAIYKRQVDELTIKSLKIESELKTQVAAIKGEKDAKVKDIDRKYRTAIDSLRQRQERSTASNSTGSSCNTESTKGATGAELYREDATFLAGFARDTEELKTHLNACYLQYDTVKQQLDNYRK